MTATEWPRCPLCQHPIHPPQLWAQMYDPSSGSLEYPLLHLACGLSAGWELDPWEVQS